jgi:dihydrofolate reductase
MLVSLVVAMDEDGVIGRDDALPWRLPDDLKRFKALTMGKPILMGRKTFDSIGKPLPGRLNLVLTRSKDWKHDGVTVVHSMQEAQSRAGVALAAGAPPSSGEAPELCVIGGEEIFRLALPLAQRIHLTEVHARVGGDAKFPAFDRATWREAERIEHPADERHAYAMTFSTLDRIRGGTS